MLERLQICAGLQEYATAIQPKVEHDKAPGIAPTVEGDLSAVDALIRPILPGGMDPEKFRGLLEATVEAGHVD